MKFGYCTGFSTYPHFQLGRELLPLIRKWGFDYAEFPLMNFYGMSDSSFSELIESLKGFHLSTPVACNFFPGSIMLVGKDVNEGQIASYLDVVLPRCQQLGISKIILGSGPSRTFPSGQSRDDAYVQFAEIVSSIILPKVEEYSMSICIEPFERRSCNLIVSILEGLELVERIGNKHLSLMVDLYHMQSNQENISDIKTCFEYISHVHVAGSSRRVPCENDSYVYEALDLLSNLGYAGSISLETEFPEQEEDVFNYLKKVKSIF